MIHEPDVAFTDLGLAILAAFLGWRLRAGAGAVVMAGLASAALWGGIFHGFFPARTATRSGFVVWILVALSIVVVAATLLDLALRVLAPRLPPAARRWIVAVYGAGSAGLVLFVDESFATVVRFYGPALALALVAAVQQAVRTRSAGWAFLVLGFTVSAGAALLQQAGVGIHPRYFNHNAVYHVLQGIALVLLYGGFRLEPRQG